MRRRCSRASPVLAFSASLLSKHAAERSALEAAGAAADMAASRRVAELQAALAAALGVLRDKEATLAAVWGASERLDSGVAAVLRRELELLRSMQLKDVRANGFVPRAGPRA